MNDLNVFKKASSAMTSNQRDQILGCDRNDQLAKFEIHFTFSDELDGYKYQQAELARIDELISEAANGAAVTTERSPACILLEAALPPLSTGDERVLFRRMNFVRSRAEEIRSSGSGHRLGRDMKQAITSLLDEAGAVRGRLAKSYVRLVVAAARKCSRQSQVFQDLVGEGMVILLTAIDKFDYSRGFRFSTYLTHCLRRHYARFLQRMQRHESRFVSTPDDILVGDTRGDSAQSADPPPEFAVHQLINAANERLEEREQSILHRRYGTGDESTPQTLRQIAADLGMSKERVRQIQTRALSKLRGLAMELKLASALG